MRDIIPSIDTWLSQRRKIAFATVIKTWGSSPCPAGSMMAVTEDARIAGSVSGGCVEGAVIASALDTLIDGRMRIEEYHAMTERAHDVGLSCGGSLDVCVYPLDEKVYRAIKAAVQVDEGYVHGVVIESSDPLVRGVEFCFAGGWQGGLSPSDFGEIERILSVWQQNDSAACFECSFGRIFVNRILPKPQIISIGATHISIGLMKMAQVMGYRTAVIDPRAVFATEERFSFVDELIHGWPEEVFKTKRITAATALCVLAHDPKIDEPALVAAARSEAFYIGSLGKAATQLKRCNGLFERGLTREEIARIHGPIGLDIGGKSTEEIALSILSEINAVKYGKGSGARTMLETADAERKKLAAGRKMS